MKAWWPYVRDALPLVLEDGVLNFSTDYKFSLAKETELNLTNTCRQHRAVRHQGTGWPPTGAPGTPGRQRDHSGPGQAASGGRQDPQ